MVNCSQTFKNLNEERQQEIIQVALKEFAKYEYEKASLSTIIKNVGLAKGSFYRYFPNKRSLYLHLIDHAFNFRLNIEKGMFTGEIEDFFEMMVRNFETKIRFDIKYPVYAAFFQNINNERNSEELGDMSLMVKQKIISTILNILQQTQYRQQLRIDVDEDILAFSIMQLNLGIYEYLQINHIKKGQPVKEPEVRKIAEAFVAILKNGISK